ncbi:MAG: transglutaminaseTgpA domain-containing protein [Corynebacterium sp.]|uniref:DUF3488 and transglutaminase-like domain-containing protein n=1 Tax=Corynebacterium sp. TaxID=1720 RepID=UPI003F980538
MTAMRPLLHGVLLSALWLMVLLAFTEVFIHGPWLWRAWSIAAVVTLVTTLAVSVLPARRHWLGQVSGLSSGLLLWALWLVWGGRAGEWIGDPGAMADAISDTVEYSTTPLDPAGAVEDLLLTFVLLLATVTTVILVGIGSPGLAGGTTALLLVVPAAVSGIPVDRILLIVTGVLLVVLLWTASARISGPGFLAAAVSAVLAVAVVAALPDGRDRVWNTAIVSAPVSGSVPDVTVSLADDLKTRSKTRAFRFTADVPGPYHFTLATLADFDDGRWLPQDDPDPSGRTVDQPRGDVGEMDPMLSRTVSVTMDGLRSEWLPLPQSARQVVSSSFDPGDWTWTDGSGTAASDSAVSRDGDRYTVDASPSFSGGPMPGFGMGEMEGTAAGGDSGDVAQYLELPGEVPAAISDAAEEATGAFRDRLSSLGETAEDMGLPADVGDETDARGLGMALQSWFQGGGFVYDESAPYTPGSETGGPYSVMEGLLEQRSGFCVHYASTFAVMARDLGVPARLAVGYASEASSGDETVVRGGDLHAWPELFIDDVGWVAFEPTPGGAGGPEEEDDDIVRDAPATPSPTEPGTGSSDAPEPTDETTEPGAATPSGTDADTSGNGSSASPGGVGTILLLTGGAALGIVAILLIPAALRWFAGRRRLHAVDHGQRPAEGAWLELLATAADLHVLAAGRERDVGLRARTPEAMAEHLESAAELDAGAAGAVRELAAAVSAERYGGRDLSSRREEIRALLEEAVDGLREREGGPHTWRVVLAPRSVRTVDGLRGPE